MTSSKPGKTRLVNHFLINRQWYLVDLPGYGYAKMSATGKQKLEQVIRNYINLSQEMVMLFVLIDSRHDIGQIDMDFLIELGQSQIPFAIIFTKGDKLGPNALEAQIEKLSDGDNNAILAAEQKYAEHSKTKEAGTIYDNYGRRKAVLDNQHGKLLRELISLQASYKEGEYGTGEEVVFAYAQEYRTLSNHNLIEYEEKLNKAKEDCELEFRENFLARMRENIESAQDIFKNLNKALKNIYYGNDSYKFHYSAHSRKQGLYEMITSEVNMGGFTLFASEFEERYHSEMEDLFSKLTESDEHGDKILSEYTDYREYMDYDIEIVSKDGKSQYFSKIYGEKSGGETQTPYYVAIAASFAQMYSVGETIRIIMLDEAFDKMDDDRIENMMKFLRSQNFQIILATPPAKIETIGEYVDTVLVTYRNGYSSIVEEYDL